MKQTKYLVALFLSLFFFSCEKEEFSSNNHEGSKEEYYINPEDTAGIIVPEGYSLVYFPGGEAMTRAGGEVRISHLQYIIYQKDETTGGYIFYKKAIVNKDLSTWPITGIATTVKRGHEYKAVFLGNVDKNLFPNQTEEILTGVGEGQSFEDARIKLPSVEFSSTTLYYHAVSQNFTTTNNQDVKVNYVPIMLKRIVSRTDITRKGLSNEYLTGVNSKDGFLKAYWRQLIKEKLVGDIFLGENSTFKYQVAKGIKKNLIYPLIYFGLADPNDAVVQENNYSAIKAYNQEWENYKPNDIKLGNINTIRKLYYNSGHITSDYANNLFIRYAQYLYDIFYEDKDNAVLKGMLKQIYDDNMKNKAGHSTIDAAIDNIISAFNENYKSGILLPWRNSSSYYYSIVETNTPLPGSVDFNLNVDESLSIGTGKKCYRIQSSSDYSTDNYISIITLGEPSTSNNKLGISNVSLSQTGGPTIQDIPLTNYYEIRNSLFDAGYFHRNIKTLASQDIVSVSLANTNQTLDKYQQDIEVNIYNLFYNQMKATDAANDIKIGVNHGFAVTTKLNVATLHQIQTTLMNIITSKYTDAEFNNSDDLTVMSYPIVKFISPDVSPTNLPDNNVTTSWSIQEIE